MRRLDIGLHNNENENQYCSSYTEKGTAHSTSTINVQWSTLLSETWDWMIKLHNFFYFYTLNILEYATYQLNEMLATYTRIYVY